MVATIFPFVIAGLTGLATASGALIGHLTRRKRVNAARESWSEFARDHGLTGGDSTDGEPLRIWYGGAWGSHTVAIAAGLTAKGGWTSARVLFDPPLDLGLIIGPAGSPEDSWLTAAGLRVIGDERARTDFLLDQVRQDDLRNLRFNWNANDVGIFFRVEEFDADPTGAQHGIGALVALAETIERGRANAPAARQLSLEAGSWRESALRHGFAFGTTPLFMRGTIDDVPVAAFSFRADRESYGLGAYARFSEPLQGAVGIAPTAPGELAFWLGIGDEHPGSQDWELGDVAFDRAFVVRARDPQKLAKILPPSLCARLLRLHERFPLVVDDVMIRVASRHLPPADTVPALMREIAEIAADIELNAVERKPTAGPYR